MLSSVSPSRDWNLYRSWQIRLISVARKLILVIGASLYDVMGAKISVPEGLLSSSSATAVCVATDIVSREDLVGKMAAREAQLEAKAEVRTVRCLEGDIQREHSCQGS